MLVFGIWRAITATHAQSTPACVSAKDQEHIRKLYNEAIDKAFQEHIANLFSVWLKDYSPEPKRAIVGTDNGISAHQRAYNLKYWNPPVCP